MTFSGTTTYTDTRANLFYCSPDIIFLKFRPSLALKNQWVGRTIRHSQLFQNVYQLAWQRNFTAKFGLGVWLNKNNITALNMEIPPFEIWRLSVLSNPLPEPRVFWRRHLTPNISGSINGMCCWADTALANLSKVRPFWEPRVFRLGHLLDFVAVARTFRGAPLVWVCVGQLAATVRFWFPYTNRHILTANLMFWDGFMVNKCNKFKYNFIQVSLRFFVQAKQPPWFYWVSG